LRYYKSSSRAEAEFDIPSEVFLVLYEIAVFSLPCQMAQISHEPMCIEKLATDEVSEPPLAKLDATPDHIQHFTPCHVGFGHPEVTDVTYDHSFRRYNTLVQVGVKIVDRQLAVVLGIHCTSFLRFRQKRTKLDM
jgi:hypothetical protein